MCKPCTLKCKCKAQCNNPHNNGGKCPKCSTPEPGSESDDSDREDEAQQNEQETLPIVSSSNRDDFDFESKSE